MTSTPIKRDKENMHGAHRGTNGGGGMAGGGGGEAWSLSILQTSSDTRRHFLRETNDVRNLNRFPLAGILPTLSTVKRLFSVRVLFMRIMRVKHRSHKFVTA